MTARLSVHPSLGMSCLGTRCCIKMVARGQVLVVVSSLETKSLEFILQMLDA